MKRLPPVYTLLSGNRPPHSGHENINDCTLNNYSLIQGKLLHVIILSASMGKRKIKWETLICQCVNVPHTIFWVLIIVMLSYLALLKLSFTQSKEWSTAQLTSSAKLVNLPKSFFYSTISTGSQSAAGVNTKLVSSALYRSFRSAADAPIFRVPWMGRRTLWETFFPCVIGSVIWNSLSLSVTHSFFVNSSSLS